MKQPDKMKYSDPGARFEQTWELARQYTQTKEQIGATVRQSQLRVKKITRIWILSAAASVLLCVGLIALFKPFDEWVSSPNLVAKDKADQVNSFKVMPARAPERKAAVDSFQIGYGTVLKWDPDSTQSSEIDYQFKAPGQQQSIRK
jgi:hypothetical protein